MIARQGKNVIAAGRLTRDAEFKMVGADGNKPMTKFSIAAGDKIFTNVVCWGHQATYAEGLEKGDSVAVFGIEDSRTYEGKTYTDVVADLVVKQPEVLTDFTDFREPQRAEASKPETVGEHDGPSGDCPF
jgi:single-stranded DNA-binding protein